MVGMRLLAEGRLAEMNGPGMLEIDRFMRTVNLKAEAEVLYKNASPRIKKFFEVYARGVNAYLFRYQDRLPMDLAESGYRPAYWKPEDSGADVLPAQLRPVGQPAGRDRRPQAGATRSARTSWPGCCRATRMSRCPSRKPRSCAA